MPAGGWWGVGVRAAVVDTSIILLFFDEGFDFLDHLGEDVGEELACYVTDSTVRELMIRAARSSSRTKIHRYLARVLNRCRVATLSEDLEREGADLDVIRAASLLRGYVVTADRGLGRLCRMEGLAVIRYRESERMLEIE